mmetsp:Transcript_38097/g.59496  ORF Transcript_38097/g.59496 Transcript_38097/m.59496 type:complete len:210 (+) Transcript_38097:112-741(+)
MPSHGVLHNIFVELSRAVYSIEVDTYLWITSCLVAVGLTAVNASSIFVMIEVFQDHLNEHDAAKKLNKRLKIEVYLHGFLFCLGCIAMDIMLCCMSGGGFFAALHLKRQGRLYYSAHDLHAPHHQTMTWRLLLLKVIFFGIFFFYGIARIYIIFYIHFHSELKSFFQYLAESLYRGWNYNPLEGVLGKLGGIADNINANKENAAAAANR